MDNMISYNIIVAMDLDRGIGKDGDMPWHLPAELKHFKEVTLKTVDPKNMNAVVMGRKTWESIPAKFRPLKDRLNIVLSRNRDLKLDEGVIVLNSFEAISNVFTKSGNIENVFIIGGEQIFKEALQSNYCNKLFITHISASFDCDTFFPEYSNQFTKVSNSSLNSEADFSYSFVEYQK